MMNVTEKQELFAKIQQTLRDGGAVIVATYTKATMFKAKHIDLFKLGKDGCLYARYGKNWLCIDGCSFRFGHKA